jgi:hypothetical protein
MGVSFGTGEVNNVFPGSAAFTSYDVFTLMPLWTTVNVWRGPGAESSWQDILLKQISDSNSSAGKNNSGNDKKPRFANVERRDTHFVYGFSDGNPPAALKQYQCQHPDRRLPYRHVLTLYIVIWEKQTLSRCRQALAVENVTRVEQDVLDNAGDASTSPLHVSAATGWLSERPIWRTACDISCTLPCTYDHYKGYSQGTNASVYSSLDECCNTSVDFSQSWAMCCCLTRRSVCVLSRGAHILRNLHNA